MATTPPSGERPGREKLRRLAQAAMNADQTVEQVETILGDMAPMMENLAATTASLDTTMKSFNDTLGRVDESLDNVDTLVDRMDQIMTRIERIVARAESVVGVGETALKPLSALQSTASSVVGLLGFGGGTEGDGVDDAGDRRDNN